MRYINWNIKCTSNTEKIISLINGMATSKECIIALQEVMPNAYDLIESQFGNDYHIEYSLDYRKPSEFDTNNRRLGVMILITKDLSIREAGVIERNVFPDRTLYATTEYRGKELKIVALHSLTGVSYKMAKSAQFRTFAEYVRECKPSIVSFDANEPKIDHYDMAQMEFFDQGQGESGKGARLFFEELANQQLRDVLTDNYDVSQYVAGEPLTVSHIIGSTKAKRRYDFVFAMQDLKVTSVSYHYDEAIEATSDHAMVVVDFE